MDPITAVTAVKVVCEMVSLIRNQVKKAKANKKQCARLVERLALIEGAILGLEAETLKKPHYAQALDHLVEVLKECLALVEQFSEHPSRFHRLIEAGSHEKAFAEITEALQTSMQTLSLGLLAQQLFDHAQDQQDREEDARFIQESQAVIIALNKQTLEAVQQVALRGEAGQKLLFLQLESLRKRMQTLALRDTVVPVATTQAFLPNSIAYCDLIFEKKIGESSFGTLYQGAWHEQAVVIKAMQGTLSRLEQAQFAREVGIMSALKHPHIIAFYGACLEQGEACIVMEYMERGPLSSILHQQTLSLEQKQRLALDIAQGLNYLHQKNVLHRDLRSGTILVNDRWMAKLSDFGLSKTEAQQVQTTHERSQALPWQAPESLACAQYSSASDIYSFGVILWEIMTGRLPQTPSAESLEHYRLVGEREAIPSEIPAPMAALIRTCWHTDPLQRPSAQAVVQSLEAYARRPSSPTAEERYEAGIHYERSKQWTQAFESYSSASHKGHLKAKTNLGLFFMEGRGVAQNKQEGHKLFLEAAEGGHARAMKNLAHTYKHGHGVEKNEKQALEWSQKAEQAERKVCP